MACDVGCAVAGVFGCTVIALDGPLALGLACAVVVGLADADASPTPLTGRTRPGASAIVRDPWAAYAPPAANTRPRTLAAPITMTLLNISLMSTPISRPWSGSLQGLSQRSMSWPEEPDERILIRPRIRSDSHSFRKTKARKPLGGYGCETGLRAD